MPYSRIVWNPDIMTKRNETRKQRRYTKTRAFNESSGHRFINITVKRKIRRQYGSSRAVFFFWLKLSELLFGKFSTFEMFLRYFGSLLPLKKKTRNWKKKRKEKNEVREGKRKKNDVVAYCCYPAPLLNQHPSSFSSPICGESLIEFLVLRSPSSIRFYSLFFQAKEPSKKRPNIGREDAEDIASPTAGCVGWKLG